MPRTLHVEAEPGFPGWEAPVVHASWADAMPAGSDEGGAFEFFVDNYEPVIRALGRPLPGCALRFESLAAASGSARAAQVFAIEQED